MRANWSLVAALLGASALPGGCDRRPGEPVSAIAVNPASGKATRISDRTAAEVSKAVERLLKDPGEGFAASDRVAAQDPSKLVGRWQILHTIHKTNGVASKPAPPIVPTEWVITPDGRLAINGGMKLDVRYIYTGDKLIVTGIGPKQAYEVLSLTQDRLEVVTKISAGTTRIENTTVLRRK